MNYIFFKRLLYISLVPSTELAILFDVLHVFFSYISLVNLVCNIYIISLQSLLDSISKYRIIIQEFSVLKIGYTYMYTFTGKCFKCIVALQESKDKESVSVVFELSRALGKVLVRAS